MARLDEKHLCVSHHLAPVDPFRASATPNFVDQVLHLGVVPKPPLLLEPFCEVSLVFDIIGETSSYADAEHHAAHHRATCRSALGSLETSDGIIDCLDDLGTLGVVARYDGMQIHVRRGAEHLRCISPLACACALRLIRALVMGQCALAVVRARFLEDLLDPLTPLHELGHAQLVLRLVSILPRSQCCDFGERKHDVVLAAHHGHHGELLIGRHRHVVDPCFRVIGIVQFADDIQHDGCADEGRRREDVKPD